MKENPSPGSRKQHVFSPKRPVVALLEMMVVALSFVLLFASVGKTYAAPSAPGIVTPTSNHPSLIVSLTVTQGNPASVPQNGSLFLVAQVENFTQDQQVVTKVEFYSSAGGSTSTLIGTDLNSAEGYSMSWSSPDPGTYSLTARAYTNGGVSATSNSITATVVAGNPLPSLSVVFTSPANGDVSTTLAAVLLRLRLDGLVLPSGTQPTYVANFSATSEPDGRVIPLATVTQATDVIPGVLESYWNAPPAGTYRLTATVSLSSGSVRQTGTAAPITVQINAPTLGSCTVHYQLESQWSGGFSANVVLTNSSSVTIHGWTLAFMFPGDQQITELWNGSFAQTGEQVSITNLSYNGTIMPGGTVNLGFNGAWTSNESSPTAFTLNGHSCSTT